MIKKISLLFVTICFSLNLSSQEKIKLNTKKSSIIWEGTKLFGFGGHEGTVNFKQGEVIVKNSKITEGSFVIDMTSIQSNENETWIEDFVKHLKGKDFFDVKNYPIAKIVFTKTKYVGDGYVQINADLTINKITKPVFFVAQQNDVKRQLEARLKIDRTEWNITYKSQGKTSIKDQVISDAISFKVNLNF